MEQLPPISLEEEQAPASPSSIPPPPPPILPQQERRRPIVVTGIAIYTLAICVWMLVRLIQVFSINGTDNHIDSDTINVLIIVAIIFVLIGICSIGLLFLKRWARIGAIVSHIIIAICFIVGNMPGIISGTKSILTVSVLFGGVLISLIAIFLLFLKNTRMAFIRRTQT